jgi:hypothetical protein
MIPDDEFLFFVTFLRVIDTVEELVHFISLVQYKYSNSISINLYSNPLLPLGFHLLEHCICLYSRALLL